MNVLLCLPRLDCLPLLRLFPPVGIAYVSASLKKAGFNVYTFNTSLSVKRPLKEELRHIITENNITIVGCGGLVTDYPGIKEIIDTVKSIKPEIITFIGGSFVTYSPTEAMSLISTADIGIIGEGEVTTCELISALEAREDIRMVRGLVIRDDCGKDTITLTEPRTEITDIDSIPWPDREGFGLYDIFPDSTYGAVTTSRSCPYKCTFCAQSGGSAYRERCLDGVFDEIDYLI
ncbi:MAG: cobalamin-dependent protein, partial [Oscillospiraceae bacterium]|nr:cobalamin-dependent protein [Oscillospiraceae bacterium]